MGLLADDGVPGRVALIGGVCGLRALASEGVPGTPAPAAADGVLGPSVGKSGDLGTLKGRGILPDILTLRLA